MLIHLQGEGRRQRARKVKWTDRTTPRHEPGRLVEATTLQTEAL
jgi:hypothetical protein